MRKIAVIILSLCFLLTSCSRTIEIRGLEKFDKANSTHSLCQNLLPDDMINKFSYQSGDYFYLEVAPEGFGSIYDKALLYLTYDKTIYPAAKQYAMEQLDLSEEIVEEYNCFVFYDNQNPYVDISPYEFNRFAYNDETNTLLFIGFYASMEFHDEVDAYANDWGAFLENYYGEFYDFS